MKATSAGQPACDLCGSHGPAPLWALRFESYPGPFRLWRCRACGAAFNWPRLDQDAIAGQYDADYYVFAQPPARRWARAAQLYLEHLLPLERSGMRSKDPSRDPEGAGATATNQPPPDGCGSESGRRLLEVGCAQGDLLALAARRGWEVQGIEISPQPAQRAASEYGLPVAIGTLEEQGLSLGRFDVAIAADVLEHVPSPQRFLTALHALLRPGGTAVIETPNLDGFWSRVGGRRWLGFNRFHIYLLGAGSLIRLMRACGFRNCRASSSTHVAYAAWGARPELVGLVNALPAALRWRAQRGLNRIATQRWLSALREHPPTSLAEALTCIDSLRGEARARRPRRLSGDNLAVVAEA